MVYYKIRAVNEPNVRRTVRELFGGKFVCVRSFIKQTNTNKKFCSFC
ncbi:hypothetical protein HanIR_Chr12g0578231 [Helianthus annuus]|nr:hypothetical protein HanIR_Chr12g0578231 [Helianthus annuus]